MENPEQGHSWKGSGVFFKQPKTQPVPAPSRMKELPTVHGAAEKDSRPRFVPLVEDQAQILQLPIFCLCFSNAFR